ncbi:MAG: hypothetical protein PHD61_01820 [Bacteroidales bacterium]|nr:hypothetical protein [Lentimicrobiaceae bacterium]MDD5694029.1 hypothetical protein [Bacteroidales bacterium]
MKNFLIILFCCLSVTSIVAQGDEQLKQNFLYRIDSLGNATIDVSAKMTASQWQYWEATYGGKNISLFKRDLSRTLSQLYLYDFDYNADEMERSFHVTFKAKGVSRYKGNNEWLAEMGMKDPDFSKLNDNSFLVTTTFNEGGLLIQQNNTIHFPRKASNIKEETDEFGNAIFTYDLKPVSGGTPLFLILGLAFIALGILSAAFFKFKPAKVQQ